MADEEPMVVSAADWVLHLKLMWSNVVVAMEG